MNTFVPVTWSMVNVRCCSVYWYSKQVVSYGRKQGLNSINSTSQLSWDDFALLLYYTIRKSKWPSTFRVIVILLTAIKVQMHKKQSNHYFKNVKPVIIFTSKYLAAWLRNKTKSPGNNTWKYLKWNIFDYLTRIKHFVISSWNKQLNA